VTLPSGTRLLGPAGQRCGVNARVADVLVDDAGPDICNLRALREVSVIGPRNRVDKITRKLVLLP
jgi:hypothetical protein